MIDTKIRFGLLVLGFTVISCSPSRQIDSVKSLCDENLAFKKIFFNNVQNIDSAMTKQFDNIDEVDSYWTDKRIKSFQRSLKFISNYSKVSFESMLNYNQSYPYGIFEEDRKKWINWYEDNKCRNIQFKDTIYNK